MSAQNRHRETAVCFTLGVKVYVLRTITETNSNDGQLISDIVGAISDIMVAHPRWPDLGSDWLAAFDQIELAEVRTIAQRTNVQPLRLAIVTLLCIELEKILGPSVPPKPPVRTKAERMSDHLALGVALLKLKADEPKRFGAIAYERFKVDPKGATTYRAMAAAKLYSARPEITSRVSWQALAALSAPSLPPAVRRKFEKAVMTGQKVMVPHIERARKAHAAAKRPAAQTESMAA